MHTVWSPHLVAHEHKGARPRGGVERRDGGNPGSALVLVRERPIRRLEDAHRAVLAAADDVLRQGALGRALADGEGDDRPFVPPVVLWVGREREGGKGGEGRGKASQAKDSEIYGRKWRGYLVF